jgi:hypothetical protein
MNPKSSLLTALRKYRPRANSDPLENFITEAFAWLLQNHSKFGHYFLKKIIDELKCTSVSVSQQLGWETQVNLNGKQPDLVCEAGEVIFIFEHKAWAHLHQNQLDNYRANAARKYDSAKIHIILIAGGTHLFDQKPDLAICWRDVYLWIEEWQQHTDYEADFLFADFCALLESEGMGPPAPISHESILAYHLTQTFEKDLSDLLQRVIHQHKWVTHLPEGSTEPKLPKHRGRREGNALYGRYGFYLQGEEPIDWIPGLFVGFLLRAAEHRMTWLHPQSPDFTIIVSVESEFHSTYPTRDSYLLMRDELRRSVELNAPEFDFLDHLNTSEHPDGPNFWHPIHIRMPMLELFRGTKDPGEQDKRFIEAASKILMLISECQPFWVFRDELRSKQPQPIPI